MMSTVGESERKESQPPPPPRAQLVYRPPKGELRCQSAFRPESPQNTPSCPSPWLRPGKKMAPRTSGPDETQGRMLARPVEPEKAAPEQLSFAGLPDG